MRKTIYKVKVRDVNKCIVRTFRCRNLFQAIRLFFRHKRKYRKYGSMQIELFGVSFDSMIK